MTVSEWFDEVRDVLSEFWDEKGEISAFLFAFVIVVAVVGITIAAVAYIIVIARSIL